MKRLKDFIEVTSLYDGRKAVIRAESIEAVLDNSEERDGYGMKPAHRRIIFGVESLDVVESFDEILDMMWDAEF